MRLRIRAIIGTATLSVVTVGCGSPSPSVPHYGPTPAAPTPITPEPVNSSSAAFTTRALGPNAEPSNPIGGFPLPAYPVNGPSPVTSLSDPRIREVPEVDGARIASLLPSRPLKPQSLDTLQSTLARTRFNSVPSGGTEHSALGPYWSGSNLNGIFDYIPFPYENGYSYTPNKNDTIFVSSSPDGDPTSCVEFGISLVYQTVSFYAVNQCSNSNYAQGYLPNTTVANHQITSAMFQKYENRQNGQATVEEIKQSDGLHLYIYNYSNSTYDDALGYAVTGNDPTSGGMWLATEYYLAPGTCPNNESWEAWVQEIYPVGGSGFQTPSSAPGTGEEPPASCMVYNSTSGTSPYWDLTPIYNTTGYSLSTH